MLIHKWRMQTSRTELGSTVAGELRMAGVFWMGLRKLSLLISLHCTPHTEELISLTQCDCLGGGGPAMADKMNKSADQEESKKGR